MSRELRTFVGALYADAWVFQATSKAEAGRLLFNLIPAKWRKNTSKNALAKYVGPLCWCPKHQRLWFKIAVAEVPRVLHPKQVPDPLWAGISLLETNALEIQLSYSHGKGSSRVTAKVFEKRSGRNRRA